MLVLMETLADVGASHYFGLPTFSANIYKTWFALGERSAALLLAVVLLLAIALIYALERWARGRSRQSSAQGHRPWPRQPLRSASAFVLVATLLLPVLFGFLLPLANLLWLLLREPVLTTNLERFWGWLGHSLTLGLLGATLTVLLATAFAYALRFGQGPAARWLRWGAASLSFGYAVPGAVIALAILWPVASADNWLADRFGWQQTLLSGSIAGLLYAYLLRFFAVAWGGIDAAVGRLSPNLDAAARSLGAARWQVFGTIHLPLLWRSLAVAWMLVLIDVMKELPATLMLRPFNYDTLAVIAQQLAQDERLAEAALPSIAIVLAGLLPVIGLSRLLLGGRRPEEA
jgi:iron(III) transport system permease protein